MPRSVAGRRQRRPETPVERSLPARPDPPSPLARARVPRARRRPTYAAAPRTPSAVRHSHAGSHPRTTASQSPDPSTAEYSGYPHPFSRLSEPNSQQNVRGVGKPGRSSEHASRHETSNDVGDRAARRDRAAVTGRLKRHRAEREDSNAGHQQRGEPVARHLVNQIAGRVYAVMAIATTVGRLDRAERSGSHGLVKSGGIDNSRRLEALQRNLASVDKR